MQILIIRHAIAQEREEFAKTLQDDDLRPLTAEGRSRMKQAAAGLAKIANIHLMAHSPLVRARETTEILGAVFPEARAIEVPELSPGRGPETVAHWLGFVSDEADVALVGHEPDLSELIAWLTTGEARSFHRLKKGGAVMLECPSRPGPGSATLLWALTPKQLRNLSKTT